MNVWCKFDLSLFERSNARFGPFHITLYTKLADCFYCSFEFMPAAAAVASMLPFPQSCVLLTKMLLFRLLLLLFVIVAAAASQLLAAAAVAVTSPVSHTQRVRERQFKI